MRSARIGVRRGLQEARQAQQSHARIKAVGNQIKLSRRRILSLAALLTPACGSQPPERDVTLVLHDATIVDGPQGPLPHRTVIVKGDRIAEITESGLAPPANGHRVIDAADRFLIPGLWDMHVHLSNTKASALPTLLANGVTSVRDMGGRLSEIDQWRGEIRAGKLLGPRIFRSGPMLNGKFADYQLLVRTAAEARGAVRALQRSGVDFIKLHRMTPRDAYFGIVEESKALGIPFAGHIPRTVSPEEASDAGQWTIEHVETLFEGTLSQARDDIPLAGPIERFKKDGAAELFGRFAKNRNWYTPTLAAFEAGNRFLDPTPDRLDAYISQSSWEMLEGIRKDPPPPAWLKDRMAQFPHHLELVGIAHNAGVGLLAGTDMAARIVPGFSLHRELELLVHSGLPPLHALRAATSSPARALGQGELGTIEPGKLADMVLLRADPLKEITNVTRIDAVISCGRVFDRQALDRLLAQGRESAKVG